MLVKQATRMSVLDSVRDVSGLYGLSNEALESAVGDIVREDGFIQLVRSFTVYRSHCLNCIDKSRWRDSQTCGEFTALLDSPLIEAQTLERESWRQKRYN